MPKKPIQILLFIFTFALGALATYLISKNSDIHLAISSAAVGLLGSFWPHKNEKLRTQLRACLYCGTFAGMTSTQFVSTFEMALISVLGGIIFFLVRPFFVGFGGKLGTTAFIAVLIFMFLGSIV